MNIYITFGGRAYDNQTKLTVERAHDFGADQVRVFDDAWLIQSDFYRLNRWIFERQPQMGFGWCSWKPYILALTLKFVRFGDAVLYVDADTYPVADLRGIFEHAREHGVMLFEEQGCANRHWTRSSCWQAMGSEPKPDTMIACGRFQAFGAGWPYWPAFMEIWQKFSLDPRCQFHDVDHAVDPEVIRNSAEQSVLSVLAASSRLPLHRTPDQNGWPVAHGGTYKPEDSYPQLFFQDGNRGDLRDLRGSLYRNV